jgi:hypothetical protein
VTKRGWPSDTIRVSPTGEIEVVRAPTKDELLDLLLELMDWRGANPAAMPPKLFVSLRQLLEWQATRFQWSRHEIMLMRWSYVRDGRRGGMKAETAYRWAAENSRGTPFEAGAEMMKKDYEQVEQRQRKSAAR